ncbi:hypothetical protein PTKU64_88180 [Paraburkholderia terrae]|uniref:Uncharacterized protein n=1 Tax=Paraburkholderia terrae TaxID=311230 RepID=A0ABN6JYY6_9BURK|nr:hypothetical protein PTKU64_88180 [Paraburkholderia terrae]
MQVCKCPMLAVNTFDVPCPDTKQGSQWSQPGGGRLINVPRINPKRLGGEANGQQTAVTIENTSSRGMKREICNLSLVALELVETVVDALYPKGSNAQCRKRSRKQGTHHHGTKPRATVGCLGGSQ